jgi:hypothetical protein
MKHVKSLLLIFLFTLSIIVPLAYSQKEGDKPEEIIKGFTIVKATDTTARIQISDGSLEKIEDGKFYAFPVTLKSNRSQIFIQFSEANTAKLLPQTVLHLSSPEVRHPKLKLLSGQVALELDKFPKDHKIEVSTPTAVCGAVGTRFEVSYSGEDKQLGIDRAKADMNQSFKCSKGEIFVASNSFRIGGVRQGQAVTTKSYDGKENSYCSVNLEKGVNTKSFKITLPDSSEYVAAKGTRFEIAKPKDSEIAVVKVQDNNLQTLGFFAESPTGMAAGKSYVKVGDEYIPHADTEQYLSAAAEEGYFDARVKEVDLELAILSDANKDALKIERMNLEVKRDDAAKKASAIAQRMIQDRNIRSVIQKVRQNINRQQMRRVK